MTVRPENWRVVVVVGMVRSGTSAVTRCLKALGVELGDQLMAPAADNPSGFWEDRQLLDINERLLASQGHTWQSLRPLSLDLDQPEVAAVREEAMRYLLDRFGGAPTWGFKDPRTSILLDFWQRVFLKAGCEDSYLLVARHPASVAASLRHRQDMPTEAATLLWLKYNVEALGGILGRRCMVLDYDRFLDQPAEQLDRVARGLRLDLDPTAVRRLTSEFLDQGLRHTRHAVSPESVAELGMPRVAEIHQLLLRLAGDEIAPDDGEVAATVSSSRVLLRDWRPVLTLADVGARLQELEAVVRSGAEWAKSLEDEIRKKEAEIEVAAAHIATIESALRERIAELDEKHKEMRHLQLDAAVKDDEREAARIIDIERLRAEIDEHDRFRYRLVDRANSALWKIPMMHRVVKGTLRAAVQTWGRMRRRSGEVRARPTDGRDEME